MDTTTKIGNTGEQLATEYLIKRGYEIVVRNYRYKKAEVDIIARKDKLLIFVEVKTRRSNLFGEPEEAVNQAKITLLLAAAEHFVETTDWRYDIRFDIMAIRHDRKPPEITHFEDAFY